LSDQGEVYSAFIAGELLAEDGRRADVNSAARAAVTASGAQLGLATALILFLRGKDYRPGPWSAWLFAVSLAMYLASAALGLIASQGHKAAVVSPSTMHEMLGTHWTDGSVTAKNHVAWTRVASIAALRQGNNIKTRWLKRSVSIQVLAVGFLGTAFLFTVR
jgi:hypothetical protein